MKQFIALFLTVLVTKGNAAAVQLPTDIVYPGIPQSYGSKRINQYNVYNGQYAEGNIFHQPYYNYGYGTESLELPQPEQYIPTLPSLPSYTSYPTLPPLPSYPTVPSYPLIPSYPSVPSYPSLPSLPSYPTVPSYPSIPSYPSVPSYVQAVPAVPSVPSVTNGHTVKVDLPLEISVDIQEPAPK